MRFAVKRAPSITTISAAPRVRPVRSVVLLCAAGDRRSTGIESGIEVPVIRLKELASTDFPPGYCRLLTRSLGFHFQSDQPRLRCKRIRDPVEHSYREMRA